MALIHIPTVYLFLSFIYLLMPIAIWIALNNRKSKSMIWWCTGGGAFRHWFVVGGVKARFAKLDFIYLGQWLILACGLYANDSIAFCVEAATTIPNHGCNFVGLDCGV